MLSLSKKFDLADHPTQNTILLIASLLKRMTEFNDMFNKDLSSPPTQFHSRFIPSIDILSYLTLISRYCPCRNECFLSLLVYFDRMSKRSFSLARKPFMIDSFSIHRLIITGIMLASKFFSDTFYTNKFYAKVGGLPLAELNLLEIEFLKLNDFNITVSVDELQRYGDQLISTQLVQNYYCQSFYTKGYTSSGNPGMASCNKLTYYHTPLAYSPYIHMAI
ncbi:cyclin-domain-containing protein [Sporodiniella umbellata]|nr:cyclin-domain-containing protein [Sporodiniella umbellata]